VWHYDEPLADSSAVPTWYVSELARQHVTVALSGDGGDELFTGYPRYRAVWLASRLHGLPSAVRSVLFGRWWQKVPSSARQKSLLRKWKRFTEVLGAPPGRRYLNWIGIFDESSRAELYSDDFLAALPEADPAGFFGEALARFSGRDPVTASALADLITYLPCDLMTKVDIASMAHGLECRQPFLDYRLVELAGRIPLTHRFRWGRGKRILLRAFADLLPRPIRRRRKMGFGVPLDHWFRGPLSHFARDVLLDQRARQRGLFRPEAVERLLEDHQSGRFDRSYRLWALLIFELWQREWVDHQPPPSR
jgi:asparagine synthase (glutamine-hydrolysing)